MEVQMIKSEVIKRFDDIMFASNRKTICSFITETGPQELFEALEQIESRPLSKEQLDRLLLLHQQKSTSDDFFCYYWLGMPEEPICDVETPAFAFSENKQIASVEQLKWGFKRIFIDCLLMFGNIQKGYDALSCMTMEQLRQQFEGFKLHTGQCKERGNTVGLEETDKEERYFILEMACKNFAKRKSEEEFVEFVLDSYKKAIAQGVKRPLFKDILSGEYNAAQRPETLQTDLMGDEADSFEVCSEQEAEERARDLAERFWAAHRRAFANADR